MNPLDRTVSERGTVIGGLGLVLVRIGLLIHLTHVIAVGAPGPGWTWSWWLPFVGCAVMLAGVFVDD